MPRWVSSYWAEEDITFLWEVGDDGRVSRSVEFHGPDRQLEGAASLTEVLHERDTGGITAVQRYEAQYGRPPDQPIDDWDFPHVDLTSAEFEAFWSEARRRLAEGL